MSDQGNTPRRGGSQTGIALIVGGLVVAVLVIAFFMYDGNFGNGGEGDVDVQVETPATGEQTGGGGEQTGGGNTGGGGQTGGQGQ